MPRKCFFQKIGLRKALTVAEEQQKVLTEELEKTMDILVTTARKIEHLINGDNGHGSSKK